ncbi:hypothetical protein HYC85_017033 [Camellia sinensis]|uniref:PsbP C-terminal domain-containing protein n=1 Tax=Camellia sinensis TaxID=4442 RepID=A0A7J7H2L4_CAMSI|nr:hypothetical protein HYC85_017033 [Camellia sinensis]
MKAAKGKGAPIRVPKEALKPVDDGHVYSAPTQMRTIDGKNYYTFEYALTSPNFSRAAFATIAIGNGTGDTLIVGANERRWRRMRNQLKVVEDSFKVLVYHDLLGMMQHPHHAKVTPKFCKQYGQVGDVINKALSEYKEEVTNGFVGELHPDKNSDNKKYVLYTHKNIIVKYKDQALCL